MKFSRGPGRTKWLLWVSHASNSSFNLQPLFMYLNFPQFRSRLLVLKGYQDGKSLTVRGHFLIGAEWTSYTCDTTFIDFCYYYPCLKVNWGSSLILSFHPSSVPHFWWQQFQKGKRITARRLFTCCPFLIGVPEDGRKSLCFHIIPEL